MKRGIYYLVILLIIFSITFISTTEDKHPKIDKKIINELEKSESVRVMIKYKEENQKELFSTKTQIIPKEKIRHQFEGKFSATLTEEEIMELENNLEVESVEIIEKKYLFLQESVPLINGTEAQQIQINNQNLTGKGQTICVLDTGVDFTHPDLQGQNVTCNIDCISGANCFSNCSLGDNNGHGTHVAGIVAANGSIKGVAPGAKIASVTVCNTSGCWDNDIEAGIQWCINNQENYNISVISMSLGGGQYSNYCNGDYLSSSINNAVNQNISVATATGNTDNTIYTNPIAGIASPACIENSIRVTAINKDESYASYAFRHQNFLDIISAPGTNINSTMIQNPSGNILSECGTGTDYCDVSGTSMSTPHVSGAIAILNQYKKLESNKTLTPNEIETILINAGKPINDTGETNENFSKIQIYQTILYADEQAPNITYMSPPNNSLREPQNQSFTCNATDLLQFANLTIEIYNLTSLVKNISANQTSLTTYINTTIDQVYNWSCIAKDNNSNAQTKTFFLTSSPIQTQIISPENNTYTNQNETEFNCSAETTKELSNMTLFIYENNTLIHNETKNTSGNLNYSIFNYNLTNETTYKYNCLAINNLSEQHQTKNNTITYDITKPKINLTSPTNNTRTQTKTHTFQYNQTESNKDYCNLTINNQKYSSFTQTLSNGIYHWNVTCTDLANNTNTSATYKLTIYTEVVENNGGGSSSSTPTSSTIQKTIEITGQEIIEGTTKNIDQNTITSFKIKNNNHQLKLHSLNTNKANITIYSTPINIILYQYQSRKINLDNDKTYDLEIILLSIENEKADIFMKEINETIAIKHLFEEQTNKTIEIGEPKITFFQKILNLFQKLFNFIKRFRLF